MEMKTIRDWLVHLSKTNESTEEDSLMMQRYLRNSGYKQAVVTYGVVYPTGYGMPTSVHAMAKHIIEEGE